MTGWSDDQTTGHMTSFLSTQLNAPSIGMLIDTYMSSYMIQCSCSHFFISTLALSPHWAPNYVAFWLYLCDWDRAILEGKTETRHMKF